MPLPSKVVDTTQAHLEQLIQEQVLEGPHIDFKRELPPAWNDAAKHELCADVSAFANAGGGDLIYGIDENAQGQAAAVVPQSVDPDATALRMADVLLNGVEPRLPGVLVQPVRVNTGGNDGTVFVVRVPQSWVGPHRVRQNARFFIREGNRKRELNVPEIRELFVRSDSQAQKVRDFRTERLGKILTGEAPCRLSEGSIWVLHLIPTQAALGTGSIDPLSYWDFARQIPILGTAAMSFRVNLDGALGLRNEVEGVVHGYTQLFRNGFVEAVQVLSENARGTRILHGSTYEDHAAKFLGKVRAELTHAGFHPEISVMMSLLDANRIELGFDRTRWDADGLQGTFDRRTVALPDVLVPAEVPPHEGLKPMFDLVWQAAGMTGSINFDDNGRWNPPRV
ncbi:ATP-binding protein [Paraburkholderia sp. SIMBA_055]|uniref:AlbA family DNA-binding domain-containing protein n=1 Tax=unclassified Paraburkholderia TaxID=2615204 RepID=UPI000D4A6C83|nr:MULTISPECIES: ATP-binding protein [unclassified Paraburkholderia]PTQ96488.1 putative DNA-binding protein [Paraburkholderia sp. GV072]PUB00776.1 putative DNA-binding protein [Paraburkholderia sp. GV068]